jgi:uncharacterized damage-inducible protein DinB
MTRILINDIIRQLRELEEGSLWFDQSFKSKLDHLSTGVVFVQPVPGVHSVAEHVAHIIAWRKECIARFHGDKFDLMNTPADWPSVAELRGTGWPALKDQLYQSTHDLIRLFDGVDDTYLNKPFRDTTYNNHYLIEGILQHDIYHLGQIGVTLKLIDQVSRS